MNQYEQLVIEYYTTSNNQRRGELQKQIVGEVTTEQQVDNLIQSYLQFYFSFSFPNTKFQISGPEIDQCL